MDIRAYQEPDLHAVIDLWGACGLLASHNDPKKDIVRKLQVNPELFLVGVREGAIVGTVMGGYEGHRGWVNCLAVLPVVQRKGYARKLMMAVESLLIAKGCPKINLQVRSNNAQVLEFYDSIGYRQDDVVSLGKRLEQD